MNTLITITVFCGAVACLLHTVGIGLLCLVSTPRLLQRRDDLVARFAELEADLQRMRDLQAAMPHLDYGVELYGIQCALASAERTLLRIDVELARRETRTQDAHRWN